MAPNFCYLFFFIIVYFLATSRSMWDLSPSTRDQTCAPCIGNTGVLTTGPPILLKKNSKNQLLSHVQLFETPWTVACQASLSKEFSRQEHWSG